MAAPLDKRPKKTFSRNILTICITYYNNNLLGKSIIYKPEYFDGYSYTHDLIFWNKKTGQKLAIEIMGSAHFYGFSNSEQQILSGKALVKDYILRQRFERKKEWQLLQITYHECLNMPGGKLQ